MHKKLGMIKGGRKGAVLRLFPGWKLITLMSGWESGFLWSSLHLSNLDQSGKVFSQQCQLLVIQSFKFQA